MKGSAGKGDLPRPCDKKKFELGYLRAFGVCTGENCPKKNLCKRYRNRGKTPLPSFVDPDIENCKWFVKETGSA